MSTDKLEATIATLLSRIQTLEAKEAPKQTGIDLAQFAKTLIADPINTLKSLPGFTAEHLTHVKNAAIVDFLGPNAPMQMQMSVNAGPQMIAMQAANAAVADLSRQVNDMTTAQKNQQKREKFKAISALKEKYPNLSKAISANPDRYVADLEAHGGTAEEFATKQEESLKEIASFLGVAPAPTESVTSDNEAQSTQGESATKAAAEGTAKRPSAAAGVAPNKTSWSEERYQQVKADILSKITAPTT